MAHKSSKINRVAQKSSKIHHMFNRSLIPENPSQALTSTSEDFLRILEASRKLPGRFPEKSKNHENLDFLVP